MPSLFSDSIVVVIAQVLGVAFFAGAAWFWKQEETRKKAEEWFIQGVPVAFKVVDEIAKKTPNKVDDKIALGLKVLADFMGTHKAKLTGEQAERAKLLFHAIHYDSKKEVKL